MECWERTRQYSLLYFLFACFIVVVPHCYDICSHFFAVKFILLCSVYRVEDSHLITVQIIDALLPEDCSHSTKDNLISTIWINIIAPLTVTGKLCILSVNTYILPLPTQDVVKRKPIDRARKESFSWFYLLLHRFFCLFTKGSEKRKRQNKMRQEWEIFFLFWSCKHYTKQDSWIE